MSRLQRFNDADRRRLLLLPQIGPQVVVRLEAAGYDSLAGMRCDGLDAVLAAVCEQVGTRVWTNRRGALARALGTPD